MEGEETGCVPRRDAANADADCNPHGQAFRSRLDSDTFRTESGFPDDVAVPQLGMIDKLGNRNMSAACRGYRSSGDMVVFR